MSTSNICGTELAAVTPGQKILWDEDTIRSFHQLMAREKLSKHIRPSPSAFEELWSVNGWERRPSDKVQLVVCKILRWFERHVPEFVEEEQLSGEPKRYASSWPVAALNWTLDTWDGDIQGIYVGEDEEMARNEPEEGYLSLDKAAKACSARITNQEDLESLLQSDSAMSDAEEPEGLFPEQQHKLQDRSRRQQGLYLDDAFEHGQQQSAGDRTHRGPRWSFDSTEHPIMPQPRNSESDRVWPTSRMSQPLGSVARPPYPNLQHRPIGAHTRAPSVQSRSTLVIEPRNRNQSQSNVPADRSFEDARYSFEHPQTESTQRYYGGSQQQVSTIQFQKEKHQSVASHNQQSSPPTRIQSRASDKVNTPLAQVNSRSPSLPGRYPRAESRGSREHPPLPIHDRALQAHDLASLNLRSRSSLVQVQRDENSRAPSPHHENTTGHRPIQMSSVDMVDRALLRATILSERPNIDDRMAAIALVLGSVLSPRVRREVAGNGAVDVEREVFEDGDENLGKEHDFRSGEDDDWGRQWR